MIFDGGQLAFFMVAIFSFLAMVAFLIVTANAQSGSDSRAIFACISIVLGIVMTITLISGFASAAAHGVTVHTKQELQNRGFIVLWVNTTDDRAEILAGKCWITFEIKKVGSEHQLYLNAQNGSEVVVTAQQIARFARNIC